MEARLACCGMLCGPSGLSQNRAQTVMALTGVCASVSDSAVGCEDGGPAHWPWDAL